MKMVTALQVTRYFPTIYTYISNTNARKLLILILFTTVFNVLYLEGKIF